MERNPVCNESEKKKPPVMQRILRTEKKYSLALQLAGGGNIRIKS